jgi:hypothetical protein
LRSITVPGVNQAFVEGWWHLKTSGVREESRNGPVLVSPDPVCTTYFYPQQRVLFNEKRDANPVFHLMESLWMLAGQAEIAWLEQFNAGISRYAEPEGYIHGAYGARWRFWSGFDQLDVLVDKFKNDLGTRHGVLQMWDAETDIDGDWKDRPCNTHIYFDCRPGMGGQRRLNMTVCCRSNDMLWGAYGANVVHMSILQEWLAAAIGVPMGVYRQMSNNFHVYLDNEQVKHFLDNPPDECHQKYPEVYPLLSPGEPPMQFLTDCDRISSGALDGFQTRFFKNVAGPLADAYLSRKAGRPMDLGAIADCDWKQAFQQWLNRRSSSVKS